MQLVERMDDVRSAAKRRLETIQENKRLYDKSLETFAGDALIIRPKEGGDRLFTFNEIQSELDVLLDNQKHETGQVRALVLKARQVGITTYCAARIYHRVTRTPGTRALMMSHLDETTTHLLNMVKRFAEFDPYSPKVTRSNRRELWFGGIDSGIATGIAGAANADVGRGRTYQFVHLTEVALWNNPQEHALGVMEALPDLPGTEAIQESTAKGIGNFWHAQCMAAEREKSNFQLIFLPFYLHSEYQADPPSGWVLPMEFRELGDAHALSMRQLYWAWRKNRELAAQDGDDPDEITWKFRQEYPCTIDEAFRASRKGGFIKGSVITAATRAQLPLDYGEALILGCDFATGGGGEPGEDDQKGDLNAFTSRRGRVAGRELYEAFHDRDAVSVADKLANHINHLQPAWVCMDQGGGGAQVHDILRSRGYRNLVLVNFGSGARDTRKWGNRRAEMYGETRAWLSEPGGADIPDDLVLESELSAITVHRDEPNTVLVPKRKLRETLGFSTDRADALVLTHAVPLSISSDHRAPTVTGTDIVDPIGGY